MLQAALRRTIAPIVLVLFVMTMGGCAAGEKPPIDHTTLPTREVQASYPGSFSRISNACMHVVQDELGYEVHRETVDDSSGKARIEGVKADGSSVRVELKRSRDLKATDVTVFAVPPGATEASVEAGLDVLDKIENCLWPPKQ